MLTFQAYYLGYRLHSSVLCWFVMAVYTFVVCKLDVFFSKRARFALNTASTLYSKGPTSLRWIWRRWPKNSTKPNGCGWLKVVLTQKITGSFWRYHSRNCDYFVFFTKSECGSCPVRTWVLPQTTRCYCH